MSGNPFPSQRKGPLGRSWIAMLAFLTQGAGAQLVATRADLPLALALKSAHEAVKACEAAGYPVTVTVVDPAGLVKVVLKGDRSTVHTRDSSYRKAYTVVTMGPIFKFDTTSQFAERLRSNPSASALVSLPDILPLAGGVAIRWHGEIIGALGVGGAPGGDKDEACAQAGVVSIRENLEGQ